ncbi:hypothetical protein ABNC90_05920 [Paenibacillus larvae]
MAITSSRQLTALRRGLGIGAQRVVMSGLVTAVVRSMVRLRTLETLVALALAIASAHTIALASEAADTLCTIVLASYAAADTLGTVALASYAAANPLSTIALSRALRIGAQRIVMSRLVSTVISRVVRLLAWEIPICRLNITSWLKFSLVALALVSRLTYVGFELVVHSDSLLVCLKFLLWKKHSIRASYSFYRKDVYYL